MLTPVICGACKATAEVNLLTTAACGNCGSDDLDFFEGSVREAGIMDYYEVVVHRRGDEAGAVEYSSADLADAVRTAEAFYLERERDQAMGPQPGTAISVDVINTGTGDVFWHNGEPRPNARFYSSRVEGELGEPERETCPKCGTANYNKAVDFCPQCGYSGSKFMRDHFKVIPVSMPKRKGALGDGDKIIDILLVSEGYRGQRTVVADFDPGDGQSFFEFVDEVNGIVAALVRARSEQLGERVAARRRCSLTLRCGLVEEVGQFNGSIVPEDEVQDLVHDVLDRLGKIATLRQGSVPDPREDEWDGTAPMEPFPEPTTFGSLHEATPPRCYHCGRPIKRDPDSASTIGSTFTHVDDLQQWGPEDEREHPGTYPTPGIGHYATPKSHMGSLHQADTYPPKGSKVRHSSPQAWRRLREHVTESELRDIAKDIAGHAGGDHESIAHALIHHDWQEGYHQGSLHEAAVKRHHYNDLVNRPTQSQGQADDLKLDDGEHRWWVARTSKEDGEPFEHTIHVEKHNPATGGWHDYISYDGDNPEASPIHHLGSAHCQFPGCSNSPRGGSTYCHVHDVWLQHLREVNSKLGAAPEEDPHCAVCDKSIHPLEVFPGPDGKGVRCLDCYAASPEGRRMPTADELTRMWGGPVRRRRSKLEEITAGILATNPSMQHEAAIAVAEETLKRFPRMAVSTAPCDDCGKRVPVPEDWPVDWTYCPECKAKNDAYAKGHTATAPPPEEVEDMPHTLQRMVQDFQRTHPRQPVDV